MGQCCEQTQIASSQRETFVNSELIQWDPHVPLIFLTPTALSTVTLAQPLLFV